MMRYSRIIFKIGTEIVLEYKNAKITDLPQRALEIMDTCDDTQYDKETDTLIVLV